MDDLTLRRSPLLAKAGQGDVPGPGPLTDDPVDCDRPDRGLELIEDIAGAALLFVILIGFLFIGAWVS